MARTKAAKDLDWPAIEMDWRAGIKSATQIGAENGVSHTAIIKRFRKLGVERDLQAKIRAKAAALVSAQEVSAAKRAETKLTDKLTIEVAAKNQADLVLKHRATIPRYQRLAESLLVELELQTSSAEQLGQLAELMRAPDARGIDKLNDLYRKVTGTPGRIDSFKKLTETYKNLVGLERQAFGLSDNANGESDAPKEAPSLTPNDAARRIAFTLLQSVKGN